ncbi:hypothetical protein [Clostridium diolis]|uniref:hypothetical protein n=1 Tax=Clostridium diolis TaxID=223919 RepID=UPI0015C6445B|nr:hypothetical protein [Clostridium diolis]
MKLVNGGENNKGMDDYMNFVYAKQLKKNIKFMKVLTNYFMMMEKRLIVEMF